MFRRLFMVGKLSHPPSSLESSGRFQDFFIKRTLFILLTFLIFGSWPSFPAEAAEVLVFLQGGGTFTKPVQSLKERHLRQVVPQSTDYSCGAAALATVLRYHFGHRMTEKDAILGMFRHGEQENIRQRGFSLLDMKRFALQQGLQAKGYRVEDVNLLKQVNVPAITLIDTNKYKHFVVIRRTDDRFVYLSDPSWGNRKMSLADFDKQWSRAILVLLGPCQGVPEGLYCEAPDEGLLKDQALRAENLLGYRIAMDPTNTMVYNTRFSDPTSIPVLIQPVVGFISGISSR